VIKRGCSITGMALLAAAVSWLIVGCGSPETGKQQSYTIDDVAAAGWTKSKQLPAETVPQASEVWYGFFNGKDIEVRVYASEADALEHGVGPAQDAVARGERSFAENRALLRLQYGHEGKWTTGELSDLAATLRTHYTAYLVVDNLVMLCETDLEPCQSLAAHMAVSREQAARRP